MKINKFHFKCKDLRIVKDLHIILKLLDFSVILGNAISFFTL